MATTHRLGTSSLGGEHRERLIAHVLMSVWGGVFLLLAFAGTFIASSPHGSQIGNVLFGVSCLVLALSAAVAWFREDIGSLILLVEGVLIGILYPLAIALGARPHVTLSTSTNPLDPWAIVVTAALAALPPIIAGLLLWHIAPRKRA